MKKKFNIKILGQHWLQDVENQKDLCSHGEVYLRIGEEELSNKTTQSWTLSSTALYLMRSLIKNHEIGEYGSQLIPCCGHLFIEDEKNDDSVIILGCGIGIDWTIRHIENDQIKHITETGEEGIIGKEEYRKLVIEFVNQVEIFYEKAKPKEIPEDEFDRKGYAAFWKEWGNLKQKIKNKN